MNLQGTFSVFISELPDDHEPIVDLLIRDFEYHRTDARIRLRHLPGILPDNFSYEKATQLAAELENADCHAGVVDTNNIPDLKHAPLLHHVRCEPQGFTILDISGNVLEALPWSSFTFLTVGAVPTTSVERGAHSQATPPASAAREPAKAPLRSDHDTMALWLATDSPERYLRVVEHEMNYEYLGDRKSTSSSENFKHLIQDILNFAPQIASTLSVKQYLDGRPQRRFHYDSLEALRDATVGQLVVVQEVRRHEASE